MRWSGDIIIACYANVQNALSRAASDGWFSVTRIFQVFREGDLQWRIKYEALYVGRGMEANQGALHRS